MNYLKNFYIYVPGYIVMRRADLNSLLDLQVIIKNISFEEKDPTIDQVIC